MKTIKSLLFGLVLSLGFIGSACASIVSYNTNVAVPGLGWLDHTYACVYDAYGCYSLPSGSTMSGGAVVTTSSATSAQIAQAQCYAGFSMTYLVDGVCHQYTNRVLFPVGAELSTSVRGYTTSRWMYGTKGTNWWSIYCAP